MKKNHLRSYRIVEPGDVEVIDDRDGGRVDLSAHYEGVPRDRAGLRTEASLDIFRYEDGRYVSAMAPNGQDTPAVSATALLLNLYLEDLLGPAGAPRSL